MAECHPVAFQWVMEAKARGATVIHVDPRFSRTSAVSDLYVPIRAGADIAFVGGLINYVLQNEAYFRDYLLAYTNAATIVTEDYADTEDLDGVFSGLNAEHRFYDFDTWRYQGQQDTEVRPASGEREAPEPGERQIRSQVRRAGRGEAHGSGGAAASATPDTDETLQHPRCVFQVLKRHFARYTPDMVEQISGVPRTSSPGSAGWSPATPAGTGPRRSSTAWAGPSTRWACSTSARLRSCSRCSATWAVRAAASSPCAGTRPFRGPPTSPRSSTCCPATCRCRMPTATTTSTATSAPRPCRTGSGLIPASTWSACSRRGGERPPRPATTSATTTCRG